MTVADAARESRARRAYEHGRLRWALARAAAAAGAASLALAGNPAPGVPAACAVALGAVLAACLWRGGAWARGARLGYLAGLAPCLLPAIFRAAHLCDGGHCFTLRGVCLTAGIAAGLLLGALGPRLQGGFRTWAAAAAAALLAGAIGCAAMGFAGLAGMTLGLLAGAAAPVVVGLAVLSSRP
jgi:hypothetical protein